MADKNNEYVNRTNKVKPMGKNLIISKERLIKAGSKIIWDVLTEATTDWNGIIIYYLNLNKKID
jgi:hypothetical protein